MNVLDPPHLDILPAVCADNRLYLIEDSRLRGSNQYLAQLFRRDQVRLSANPLEPDPRDRRCLASNGLDDFELNLALGDGSQYFLGMRYVHVSFQSLAYGLVHD